MSALLNSGHSNIAKIINPIDRFRPKADVIPSQNEDGFLHDPTNPYAPYRCEQTLEILHRPMARHTCPESCRT